MKCPYCGVEILGEPEECAICNAPIQVVKYVDLDDEGEIVGQGAFVLGKRDV